MRCIIAESMGDDDTAIPGGVLIDDVVNGCISPVGLITVTESVIGGNCPNEESVGEFSRGKPSGHRALFATLLVSSGGESDHSFSSSNMISICCTCRCYCDYSAKTHLAVLITNDLTISRTI